jgi:hypothetical protein
MERDMTRKDFELIARVVREHIRSADDASEGNCIALSFADALAGTNPNFDRARFLKACKPC